jgi:hypothetical protein
VRGPGTDRASRPFGLLPAGSARLALEKTELLLTDKRLVVSLVRTGLGVLTVPLVLLTVLVATASPERPEHALMAPLLVVCAALLAAGGVILFRGLHTLQRLEQRIATMARKAEL